MLSVKVKVDHPYSTTSGPSVTCITKLTILFLSFILYLSSSQTMDLVFHHFNFHFHFDFVLFSYFSIFRT